MSHRSVRGLGLAWLLVAVLVLALAPGRAGADDPPPGGDAGEHAQLLAIGRDGERRELPVVTSAMEIAIRGPIAQVRLTQRFVNPAPTAIEAIYVFPLPEEGAVGAMTMRIGDRRIRAAIRTRAEARAAYDAARRAGQTAALLEQERPNVFTQSVTGIGPGEAIDIELLYDVLLEPDDDVYTLALPTVVGPRYNAHAPDGARLSPPIAAPGTSSGTRFALALELDAGQPVALIDSPTHRVTVTETAPERFAIALADPDAVADKDFVLRWRIAVAVPTLALLADRSDADQGYATLIVQPPPLPPQGTGPRELVFVVDTSGSMAGEPLALAKQAMRYALDRLRPDDSFRILAFASDVAGFDGGTRHLATRGNLERGRSFVNGLTSAGGTEMRFGIVAALADPPPDGRPRYVCFMTDGYIGDEADILAAIETDRPAGTYLFSFGVGSSVNRYLLEEMARQGGGVAQILLLDDVPQPQIARFYRRLDQPMWRDLRIEWDGLDVDDATPAALPPLFAGQPVVIAVRYRTPGRGVVRLSGRAGGEPVSIEAEVELPASGGDGAVLGRLWARRRIRELAERLYAGDDPAAVRAITEIGLAHSLATAYTSFVAIEDQRRVAGPVSTVPVAVEAPEGVTGDAYGAEVISIDDRAPIVDTSSIQIGVTLSGSSSTEASYFVDGLATSGKLPRALGGSGRARGELGFAAALALGSGGGGDGGGGGGAGGGALDGRLGGELHVGLGLRLPAFELGTEARLRLHGDDRAVLSMLITLARWSIWRDLGLRLGLGGSATASGARLGGAWRAELVLPLPALGFGEALPIATFGIGGTTGGDDHTDAAFGVGLRF